MNNKIYRVRDYHIDLSKLGLSFIDFTGDERLSHRLEMRIQDLTDRKRTGSAVEFTDINKAQCEFKKLKKGLFHTATDLHLVELTVQMEDSSSEVVVGSTFDYWLRSGIRNCLVLSHKRLGKGSLLVRFRLFVTVLGLIDNTVINQLI